MNELALNSDASWLVFWNDDAVMETQDWDKEIIKHEGEFKLLAFHTHHDHPYSIFPIVPRKWLDLLGYLSPHQISDAWLSQMGDEQYVEKLSKLYQEFDEFQKYHNLNMYNGLSCMTQIRTTTKDHHLPKFIRFM